MRDPRATTRAPLRPSALAFAGRVAGRYRTVRLPVPRPDLVLACLPRWSISNNATYRTDISVAPAVVSIALHLPEAGGSWTGDPVPRAGAQPAGQRRMTGLVSAASASPAAPPALRGAGVAPGPAVALRPRPARRPDELRPPPGPFRPAERVLARPARTPPPDVLGTPAAPAAREVTWTGAAPARSPRPLSTDTDAVDLDRLTDQVVRAIDRRVVAQRERLGRR